MLENMLAETIIWSTPPPHLARFSEWHDESCIWGAIRARPQGGSRVFRPFANDSGMASELTDQPVVPM